PAGHPARPHRRVGRPRDRDTGGARVRDDRSRRRRGDRGMTSTWVRRVVMVLAAPVLALLFALAVTSVILAARGQRPAGAYHQMWDYGKQPSSIVLTLNLSTTYYLAAVAAAVGFRMNLFNIGVDGQYRIAALVTAYVGSKLTLPPILDVAILLVVAML